MPTELDYAYFASGYHFTPHDFIISFVGFHVMLWVYVMEAFKDANAIYDNALQRTEIAP